MLRFMAKMSRKERQRAAARRTRQKTIDFQTGVAETAGVAVGAYVAGRFGLTGRPLAGPLTVGGAVGLAGAAAKLMLPAADRVPLLAGATTAMVTVGATELFQLGRLHAAAGGA